jgi:hypothetical protein
LSTSHLAAGPSLLGRSCKWSMLAGAMPIGWTAQLRSPQISRYGRSLSASLHVPVLDASARRDSDSGHDNAEMLE